MATDSHVRVATRSHGFEGVNAAGGTLAAGRDLGAHIAFHGRITASTLAARLSISHDTLELLRALPLSYDRRGKTIRGKILPAAVCGVEASPVAQAQLNRLRYGSATTLDPHADPNISVGLSGVVCMSV